MYVRMQVMCRINQTNATQNTAQKIFPTQKISFFFIFDRVNGLHVDV